MRKTRIILRILSYSDLYNEIELRNYSYEKLYAIFRDCVFNDLTKKLYTRTKKTGFVKFDKKDLLKDISMM